MNRVAIVVLNYKGMEDTVACLASLIKQTYQTYTIVAIENGSGDSSTKEFKKLETIYGKKLHAIYNQENLGFAGGANTGIRWALDNQFDGIALFNNDAIAAPTWLEELVKTHKKQQSGITTGLLLHEHGDTIDSTGDWYSKWGLPFPRSRGDATKKAPEAGFVFSGSGGASLYDPAMLREISLFDETFFAYYEDVDVSFRAQLAGWKVAYTPKAIAYHKQGSTSGKMPGFSVYQTFKNLPLLYIKNVPASLLIPIGLRFLFAYVMMLGHAIKKGNAVPALRGYFKSIILFWSHALPARRAIQANKKVETSYIKELLWPDLPPDQTGLRKVRRFFIGK